MVRYDDEQVRWDQHEVEWTGRGFVLRVPVDDLEPAVAVVLDSSLADRLREVPGLGPFTVSVDARYGIALGTTELENIDLDALRAYVASALSAAGEATRQARSAADTFSRRLHLTLE
ncbi:MAG: hypothetical protein WD399_09120 [Thermoleophilaceae bacterium]